MKALKFDPLNIVVCGIGGQGNILASELLGSALTESGYKVAVGETYGASQRGGSVMSHIRVSADKEMGVLIPPGEASVILGFEPLETLRMARSYGSKKTDVIYDTRSVYPLGVLMGEDKYPGIGELEAEMKNICGRVYALPAADIAVGAGNGKAANIALMGALSATGILPLDTDGLADVVSKRFKGSVLELNLKVLRLGAEAIAARLGGEAAK